MTREQVINTLNGLKERQMSAPFSNEEKQTISQMYKDVLGKVLRVTKCNTCFHDAVIEMYVHLIKKGNTMANELKYWLRAGALIHCPAFHGGKVFSNANLTNEIAAEYLAQFPNGAKLFQRLPEPAPVQDTPQPTPKKKTAKRRKK